MISVLCFSEDHEFNYSKSHTTFILRFIKILWCIFWFSISLSMFKFINLITYPCSINEIRHVSLILNCLFLFDSTFLWLAKIKTRLSKHMLLQVWRNKQIPPNLSTRINILQALTKWWASTSSITILMHINL